MKKTLYIATLLTLLITAIAPVAPAQNQSENRTIDVIGTQRIYSDNVSAARDQAISDCLVTAISRIASDLLQQQVLIQSFQDVNRLLFLSADKFIQNYRVLTEDTTGRVYRVMVEATVSVEKMREVLQQNDILSQNVIPLRVLLLIAEQNLEDGSYRYWWSGDAFAKAISETPLSEALVKRGFVVIDHSPPPLTTGNSYTLVETTMGPETGNNWIAALIQQESAKINNGQSSFIAGNPDILVGTLPGPEMDNSQAAALGARFKADVVVVGTATVKKTSNVLGDELRSFEGNLSVRAVRTDTGLLLAEISPQSLTADADDRVGAHRALMEAGAKTGEAMSRQIQAAWQQAANSGPLSATIVVEGNYQLSHLVAFRRILSGMPGVSSLQTRGMTPEETTLSLNYEGTTKGLAEALLLNSFGGFGVHITEATPDTIRLSLVSDSAAGISKQ